MKPPPECPRLDNEDRAALRDYYLGRIEQLRTELEAISLPEPQTQAKRGAIAELRALIEVLFPQSSARPEPTGSASIYR